jgi:hypothetical protein
MWLVDDNIVIGMMTSFSLQISVHMASMIDNKVIWFFEISFQNVKMTKSFRILLNNNYANDANI